MVGNPPHSGGTGLLRKLSHRHPVLYRDATWLRSSNSILSWAVTTTTRHLAIAFNAGPAATYVACYGSDIQKWNYNVNLVGTIYETPPARFSDGLRRWGSTGDNTSNPDPRSQSTAIVHGEYDMQNATLIWNPGIPERKLPDSYYLTAKPRRQVMRWREGRPRIAASPTAP